LTTQSMALIHRHKNRIVSLTLITLQFSCRTSNKKNNTEYRTSVQKITLLHHTKKTLKRNKNSETIFHSNRCQCSRHLLKPKIRYKQFWTLFIYNTDVTKTATLHCNGILIFNNHSKSSLTKVWRKNLATELLQTITVTVPLVYPDYQPMLL
jgi:hypothetical protein